MTFVTVEPTRDFYENHRKADSTLRECACFTVKF